MPYMGELKQSTQVTKSILMVDSADHVTGKTGLSAGITKYLSKVGTAASATMTTAEVDATNVKGIYTLVFTTSHTDTLGDFQLHLTATGADPADYWWTVTARVNDDFAYPATSGRSILVDATGNVDARLADAVSHGGTLGSSTATLALSRVNATSQTSNTSAVTLLGNGTGHGLISTSGSGATGNGIVATSAASNGSGFALTGTGTGSGLLANTATVSGAVALGSTLTISGLTTLTGLTTGAISASTITASGAVAFQSTLAVTGTTTLTGAVSLGSTLGVTGLTTLGGLTTGAISASTITASGAVAFQSTFAVTTSTALAALSATTVTASGAVALQSTFAVTGATTLTGAVSATNAGNDIRLGATQNTAIATAVWGTVMDGTNTAIQVMRGYIAALLGKVSGMTTGAPTFRDIADTKNVIAATTDADGNRTVVTLDLS